MTALAVTVGPEATVAEAAKLLERHGIKRLPVVDDAGRLDTGAELRSTMWMDRAPAVRRRV